MPNDLELYTVPKEIDFPRYSTKCSGENEILRGIFRVAPRFLYISCYISEIWITFCTVYSRDGEKVIQLCSPQYIYLYYTVVVWKILKDNCMVNENINAIFTDLILNAILFVLQNIEYCVPFFFFSSCSIP